MSSLKQINAQSSTNSNGHTTFDISNAGTIHKAVVPVNIKRGEPFEIHFGDDTYVPHQTSSALWQGGTGASEDRLIKSIMKSDVFLGESKSSSEFYSKVARKHCQCKCQEPNLPHNHHETREVLAADLEYPEYSRTESRNLIFLSNCTKCKQALTHGTSFGSFNSTGIDNLKALAELAAGEPINFDTIITHLIK